MQPLAQVIGSKWTDAQSGLGMVLDRLWECDDDDDVTGV